MARGSIAKQEIINKLLKTFEGSFLYNGGKELRIPIMENGELLQIKCALTCAKTNVSLGDDTVLLGTQKSSTALNNQEVSQPMEISKEEKDKVVDLLQILNLA